MHISSWPLTVKIYPSTKSRIGPYFLAPGALQYQLLLFSLIQTILHLHFHSLQLQSIEVISDTIKSTSKKYAREKINKKVIYYASTIFENTLILTFHCFVIFSARNGIHLPQYLSTILGYRTYYICQYRFLSNYNIDAVR